MNAVAILRGLLISSAIAATPGCAPAPPVTVTSGTITAAVSPVGPPKWTYAVTSTGTKITSIELVAPINPGLCTVTPPATPATWVVNGLRVSDPAGAISATVSYTCEARNGPTYLIVKEFNAVVTIIGPIAGPV